MGFDILIIFILIAGAGLYYFLGFRPKRNPLNKAKLYIKQNNYNEAVNELKRVLYLNPNATKVHYQIADLYLKLKKNEEAIFHLTEIIRIDKYDYEIEKMDVEKKLAKAYMATSNITEAIQTYINILNIYPEDVEALYHVSFSILGQEEFDIAQKFLSRLIKFKDSFEIYFGIGICYYQNNKFKEAAANFKEALTLKSDSDIANIAVAFALMRDENYKEAVAYARNLINSTGNENVKFIAMRMLAVLLIHSGKGNESVSILENMLQTVKGKNMDDERKLTLYDLGFACVRTGKINKARNYWSELEKLDPEFKNVGDMLKLIDKELNSRFGDSNEDFEVYAADHADEWLANIFPRGFLWEICGLKSKKKFDIKNMFVTTRVAGAKVESASEIPAESFDYSDRLEKF
ncbi:MAG: tetratricopeptide repeat protein, partial [Spirochaetes bacterium]|nr:tetratricopeptide repeat protein [Spirochaetota bacterium]